MGVSRAGGGRLARLYRVATCNSGGDQEGQLHVVPPRRAECWWLRACSPRSVPARAAPAVPGGRSCEVRGAPRLQRRQLRDGRHLRPKALVLRQLAGALGLRRGAPHRREQLAAVSRARRVAFQLAERATRAGRAPRHGPALHVQPRALPRGRGVRVLLGPRVERLNAPRSRGLQRRPRRLRMLPRYVRPAGAAVLHAQPSPGDVRQFGRRCLGALAAAQHPPSGGSWRRVVLLARHRLKQARGRCALLLLFLGERAARGAGWGARPRRPPLLAALRNSGEVALLEAVELRRLGGAVGIVLQVRQILWARCCHFAQPAGTYPWAHARLDRPPPAFRPAGVAHCKQAAPHALLPAAGRYVQLQPQPASPAPSRGLAALPARARARRRDPDQGGPGCGAARGTPISLLLTVRVAAEAGCICGLGYGEVGRRDHVVEVLKLPVIDVAIKPVLVLVILDGDAAHRAGRALGAPRVHDELAGRKHGRHGVQVSHLKCVQQRGRRQLIAHQVPPTRALRFGRNVAGFPPCSGRQSAGTGRVGGEQVLDRALAVGAPRNNVRRRARRVSGAGALRTREARRGASAQRDAA
mmetsp:Transcript_39892/g.102025  ORF Transcript_39892/g.102025 Transcript_39892/m.102025 type:complete len:583 (+) Transcript_39892:107-1855(+)